MRPAPPRSPLSTADISAALLILSTVPSKRPARRAEPNPTTADVGAEPSGPVRSEPARGIGLAVKGAEAGAGAQAAGTTDEVLWGHLFERAGALQHAMRTLSAEVDALCEESHARA